MSYYADVGSLIPRRIDQAGHQDSEAQRRAGFAELERQKAEAFSYDFRRSTAVASVWLAFYIILYIHHLVTGT
jgi:hypothetical protein